MSPTCYSFKVCLSQGSSDYSGFGVALKLVLVCSFLPPPPPISLFLLTILHIFLRKSDNLSQSFSQDGLCWLHPFCFCFPMPVIGPGPPKLLGKHSPEPRPHPLRGLSSELPADWQLYQSDGIKMHFCCLTWNQTQHCLQDRECIEFKPIDLWQNYFIHVCMRSRQYSIIRKVLETLLRA